MTTVEEIKAKVKEDDDSFWSFNEVMEEFGGSEVNWKIYEQRRWVTTYIYIGKIGNQYFRMYRDMGSTEEQENEEMSEAIDSLVEVEPVEVKIIKYRVKK